MLRALIFLFSSLYLIKGYTQSEPQFTQYMYDKSLYNPAYAGSADVLEISAIYRSQYVGLANKGISSEALNVNLPVYRISSGLGITAVNDLIGVQRSTYVNLNYAYRRGFKWGSVGIGIGAGVIQTSLDGAQLRAPEGSYTNGELNHNDGNLPLSLQQRIAPDISFGVYISSKKYFAGASANHILGSSVSIASSAVKSRLNFSRNLFFTGGYEFYLSRKLSITPSFFVKTDIKEVQVDVSGIFAIIDNILAGFSFRGYTKNMIDALAVIFGFRYKGFQLVYSYDANLSYLFKFNAGSHEISLGYKVNLGKKENHGYFYHNPRLI
jgi:type IX secretion system PorP/SprF family membrane protein